MGYIKEPKGLDSVVELHVLIDGDAKIMSKIIADYFEI